MLRRRQHPRWGCRSADRLIKGGGGGRRLRCGTARVSPCTPKPGFSAHIALAAGAVRTYLWKPLQAGAFKDGAKDQAAAMATGAQASRLAAAEFAAAKPLVAGCTSGQRLVNALSTGGSLCAAAGKQLAAATVNTETLAGANSIVTTILDEAKTLGIAATPTVPSPAQLKG